MTRRRRNGDPELEFFELRYPGWTFWRVKGDRGWTFCAVRKSTTSPSESGSALPVVLTCASPRELAERLRDAEEALDRPAPHRHKGNPD